MSIGSLYEINNTETKESVFTIQLSSNRAALPNTCDM